MTVPLLDISDLSVTFNTPNGAVRAVRGLSLEVRRGEILGVVGESGCGKSVTFRALLGLAPGSATVEAGVRFDGRDVALDGELCERVSLIYQNPGAALNPVFTIGEQLNLALNPAFTIRQQLRLVAKDGDRSAMESLLERVGLPETETALESYPHQFSGGMKQRAVIAIALASQPELLIADEPTTALDVTTQAQVLELLRELRQSSDLTIVFISHDLSVIHQLCDRIAVLYAGQVVEVGTVDEVMNDPQHPYTKALLDSIPGEGKLGRELMTIAGLVPDGREQIIGCAFAPRCPHVRDECVVRPPDHREATQGHTAACVLLDGAG